MQRHTHLDTNIGTEQIFTYIFGAPIRLQFEI